MKRESEFVRHNFDSIYGHTRDPQHQRGRVKEIFVMSPGFIYVVLENRGMQQTTVTIESEAHLTRIIGAIMGGNALTKDRPAFCGKCTYGVPAEEFLPSYTRRRIVTH